MPQGFELQKEIIDVYFKNGTKTTIPTVYKAALQSATSDVATGNITCSSASVGSSTVTIAGINNSLLKDELVVFNHGDTQATVSAASAGANSVTIAGLSVNWSIGAKIKFSNHDQIYELLADRNGDGAIIISPVLQQAVTNAEVVDLRPYVYQIRETLASDGSLKIHPPLQAAITTNHTMEYLRECSYTGYQRQATTYANPGDHGDTVSSTDTIWPAVTDLTGNNQLTFKASTLRSAATGGIVMNFNLVQPKKLLDNGDKPTISAGNDQFNWEY